MVICDGRTFIAGADISEFGKPPKGASLHEVQNTIENATKPVVAAIHGTALGGGWEVALIGHHRIAIDDRKIQFGLPEVTLGLLRRRGDGMVQVPQSTQQRAGQFFGGGQTDRQGGMDQ